MSLYKNNNLLKKSKTTNLYEKINSYKFKYCQQKLNN